ncbi:MAG: hypothetical protein KGR26_04330, partial [Cyanobacteria bacterium REEB65]|nr:hypothetical protein [Cyanobacteria bacterium REEB65]
AGNGYRGSEDGRGPGAQFADPRGVAMSEHGELFVADTWNNWIRKVY